MRNDDIYASTLQADGFFGPARLVANVNTTSFDRKASIRRDGLEMFLTSNRPGGLGGLDLWISTRASTKDQWSVPITVGAPVNSGPSRWVVCSTTGMTQVRRSPSTARLYIFNQSALGSSGSMTFT